MQTMIRPEESERVQINEGTNALNGFESPGKGKMTIFVRSKRVYVESKIVTFPSFAGGLGFNLSYLAKRVAVYESVLDQDQREAVENSQALARSLGVKLEVKDVGRSNILGRLLGFILGAKIPSKTPSVSVSGDILYLLAKNAPREQVEEGYLTKVC
jgi:hypothetical protein